MAGIREKYNNGVICDGVWINGKLNGYGTASYPNGNKFIGEWLNDFKYNGTEFYADGKIKTIYKNGKKLEYSN